MNLYTCTYTHCHHYLLLGLFFTFFFPFSLPPTRIYSLLCTRAFLKQKIDFLKPFIHFLLHFVSTYTIIAYKTIRELVLSPYPNWPDATTYVNAPISHIWHPLNSIFPWVFAVAILSSWHALFYIILFPFKLYSHCQVPALLATDMDWIVFPEFICWIPNTKVILFWDWALSSNLSLDEFMKVRTSWWDL